MIYTYEGKFTIVTRDTEKNILRFQYKYDDNEWLEVNDGTSYADRTMDSFFGDHSEAYWATRIIHPELFTIIDGHCYVIGPEKTPQGSFRGFDGRKFIIQFLGTNKIVTTTNLWHNGEIPEKYRDRLPDNAKFVKENS